MRGTSSLQSPKLDLKTSQLLLAERRGSLRFPCDLRATCLVDQLGEWPATVRNISGKGIGLVLSRLFPNSSVFTIRLFLAGKTFTVQAKPTFSYFEGEPGWYHGCALLERLSVDEIEMLLK